MKETRESVNLNFIDSKQVLLKWGAIKILMNSRMQMCLFLIIPFKDIIKDFQENDTFGSHIHLTSGTHRRICTVSKNVLWWV